MEDSVKNILTIINLYYIYDLYRIGGILFRQDQSGVYKFSPLSVLEMFKAPLYIKEFWTTKLIFSNYYFLLLSGFGIILIQRLIQ